MTYLNLISAHTLDVTARVIITINNSSCLGYSCPLQPYGCLRLICNSVCCIHYQTWASQIVQNCVRNLSILLWLLLECTTLSAQDKAPYGTLAKAPEPFYLLITLISRSIFCIFIQLIECLYTSLLSSGSICHFWKQFLFSKTKHASFLENLSLCV